MNFGFLIQFYGTIVGIYRITTATTTTTTKINLKIDCVDCDKCMFHCSEYKKETKNIEANYYYNHFLEKYILNNFWEIDIDSIEK